MRIKALLFVAAGLIFANQLSAQHEGEEVSHHAEPKNMVSLFAGNTIISKSWFNLPTAGVEYVREINHFVGVGLISELEVGSHIIQKDEEGHILSEVEREGAVLILPTAFIQVYKGIILTAGYGVEFEKNENLTLLKLGLEYKLALHNPRWMVLPNISWDHTAHFDGFVYGVNFGHLF